jgi:hypothetical protein
MATLIDILIWLAIAAATTALWLYGASWRAVAKALSEAAEHPAQEAAPGCRSRGRPVGDACAVRLSPRILARATRGLPLE